jgi:hypothetical protein
MVSVVSVTVFFSFNKVIENYRNDLEETPLRPDQLRYYCELDLLVFNLYFRRNKLF